MTKIEISTILEDSGFIYDIESKKYSFKYDNHIYACFNGKEDRGYYNGKYDDTCYFSVENNENMIELPCECIKRIYINNNKKTEKLKFTVYTNFDIFIMTTFRYKAALYDIHLLNFNFEDIKDSLEESLSNINELIGILNRPLEDE